MSRLGKPIYQPKAWKTMYCHPQNEHCTSKNQRLARPCITHYWQFACFLADLACISFVCLLLISTRALCGGLHV